MLNRKLRWTATWSPRREAENIWRSSLVHSLDPKKADKSLKTFDDYSSKVFLPYLVKHLQLADRVDVVWDVYRPDSLKAFTRQCRGTGELLRVSGTTSLPSNWKSFLRVDGNKTGPVYLFGKILYKISKFLLANKWSQPSMTNSFKTVHLLTLMLTILNSSTVRTRKPTPAWFTCCSCIQKWCWWCHDSCDWYMSLSWLLLLLV